MQEDMPKDVQYKKKVSKKKEEPKQQRVFSDKASIFHDLYKLTVEKMLKNMMWYPIPPEDYVAIEHCHFFRTFDSSGRQQFYSTPVGGHFHEMEVVPQGEGEVPLVKCNSGPLKFIRRKNKYTRQFEKIIVPANDIDKHVHDIVYLQSNEIKFRKINEEAAKVIGANANLTKKPEGLDVR